MRWLLLTVAALSVWAAVQSPIGPAMDGTVEQVEVCDG